jgi:hypothetical protein
LLQQLLHKLSQFTHFRAEPVHLTAQLGHLAFQTLAFTHRRPVLAYAAAICLDHDSLMANLSAGLKSGFKAKRRMLKTIRLAFDPLYLLVCPLQLNLKLSGFFRMLGPQFFKLALESAYLLLEFKPTLRTHTRLVAIDANNGLLQPTRDRLPSR